MILTEHIIKTTLSEILYNTMLCESIEQINVVNYLYKELLLEKLLVGEPLTVPELRKILRQKIVKFEFVKLNGTVRPARGTTNMKYIPPKDHPKGIRPASRKVATFFDLAKKAWRSVSNRSKEIVLKKETDDSAVITVRDKKDKKVNQVIVKKKEEPKKPETKKPTPTTPTKPEVKKPEIKKEEPKKPVTPVKPEVKKPEPKKPEVKKPEIKKEEPKKPVTPTKPVVTKPEPKKPVVLKPEPKKPEVKPVQQPTQQPKKEIKTFAPDKKNEKKK